jgi:hypothetical protein
LGTIGESPGYPGQYQSQARVENYIPIGGSDPVRIFPAYYLVGMKGEAYVGSGDEKRRQTKNGENAPPHCMIVFPKVTNFSKFQTEFWVIANTKLFWYRLIPGRDYVEYMAWEMFPVKSWIDYMDSTWFHTVMPMARGTWEVTPDISNVRDYYFLDHKENELTLSDEESKYKTSPLDRPKAITTLWES